MEITVYIVSLIFAVLAVPAIFVSKEKLESKKQTGNLHSNQQGVLIIPVKDEECSLPLTIDSVSENINLFKILYVNDSSTDYTKEIILKQIKANKNIFLTNKNGEDNENLAPRQKVINHGINNTNEPVIAVTDADCGPCENWDSLMLANIDQDDVSMCYGYTRIDFKKCKKWGYIESVELFFLFSCAFSLKFLKLPSSCMGNNIVFKRKNIDQLGGYNSIGYAYNDDQIIMKKFRKKFGDSSVKPVYEAVMDTLPLNNIKKAINQKLRWIIDGIQVSPFVIIPLGAMLICSIALIFYSTLIAKLTLLLSVFIFTSCWSRALDEKKVVRRSFLIYLCIFFLPVVYLVCTFRGMFFAEITWKNTKVKFRNGS